MKEWFKVYGLELISSKIQAWHHAL